MFWNSYFLLSIFRLRQERNDSQLPETLIVLGPPGLSVATGYAVLWYYWQCSYLFTTTIEGLWWCFT
jgi:hypothetical protein